MDPFTHALLGATAALQRTRHKPEIYPAILCGVLAGMFPDLDVLIRSVDDPLLSLKYHRHFTHALAFVPLGAMIVAILLKITFLRKYSYKKIYLYCLFAMACHGVLDAMTNYGTHLFLPFDEGRVSWNIISIVDPIFTGMLLICVVLCAIRKSIMPARVALAFAMCYWATGYLQRELVTAQVYKTAEARGHSIKKIEVKPALANILLWRGQYTHKNTMYVDAYHSSPWRGFVRYDGDSYPLFQPNYQFFKKIGKTQMRDLDYFAFFSDGWVAEFPKDSGTVSDMRFSTLPNTLQPLWGIRFHPEDKDRHITRISTRIREEGDVQMLWQMVLGEDVSGK